MSGHAETLPVEYRSLRWSAVRRGLKADLLGRAQEPVEPVPFGSADNQVRPSSGRAVVVEPDAAVGVPIGGSVHGGR